MSQEKNDTELQTYTYHSLWGEPLIENIKELRRSRYKKFFDYFLMKKKKKKRWREEREGRGQSKKRKRDINTTEDDCI